MKELAAQPVMEFDKKCIVFTHDPFYN